MASTIPSGASAEIDRSNPNRLMAWWWPEYVTTWSLPIAVATRDPGSASIWWVVQNPS